MSLLTTTKKLQGLIEEIQVHLTKASLGNRSAARRVRTRTVDFEKQAKLYRKESMNEEKKKINVKQGKRTLIKSKRANASTVASSRGRSGVKKNSSSNRNQAISTRTKNNTAVSRSKKVAQPARGRTALSPAKKAVKRSIKSSSRGQTRARAASTAANRSTFLSQQRVALGRNVPKGRSSSVRMAASRRNFSL